MREAWVGDGLGVRLMPGFPKSRPPANAKALETWISQSAREDGVAVNRLRSGISFMVISPSSGGWSMTKARCSSSRSASPWKPRVGPEARASSDYDTAFRQAIDRVTERGLIRISAGRLAMMRMCFATAPVLP